MRFDKEKNSWLLTMKDWLAAGLTIRQYNDYKQRKGLQTTGYGSVGNPIEIILNTVPAYKREMIIKALAISEQKHETALQTAKAGGVTVSDVAIRATSRTIELNTDYIRTELRAKVEQEHGHYLKHFFAYTLSKQAIEEYARLCVVHQWLWERVQILRSQTGSPEDMRRLMRVLRASFLEVLQSETELLKKIPASDSRFANYLNDIVNDMNRGSAIHETVKLKREGNQNAGRFTEDQKLVAEHIYCNGNLSDRQVYDRIVEHGDTSGWWRRQSGRYKPIAYSSLNGWLNDNRDRLELKRSDRIGFYQNVVPTINRKYPTVKNYCWGIDGTAHNEHIDAWGSVKQHIYVIKVYDYATLRLLHTEVILNKGERESVENMVQALKNAILATGYKPYLLQMDKGPGHKGLIEWCDGKGIKVLPAQAGISRSKLIEQLLGQIQRQILNTLKGWNGQNRTAQSRASQPSAAFWDKGKSNARSFAVASEWIRTEMNTLWNEHIIEQLEGRMLNKTPDELWQAAQSKTQKLPLESLLYMAGQLHKVAKTVDGIDIQHDNATWRYVPNTDDVNKAADTWLAIRNKSKVEVYVRNYGEPVAVWQGDTYHGLWELKERVDMFATYGKDETEIDRMVNQRGFQEAVETKASESIAENERKYNQLANTDAIEALINKPVVDKRRRKTRGRLDKEDLNDKEIADKYGDTGKATPEPIYKELVDPETGEIYRIRMKSNK